MFMLTKAEYQALECFRLSQQDSKKEDYRHIGAARGYLMAASTNSVLFIPNNHYMGKGVAIKIAAAPCATASFIRAEDGKLYALDANKEAVSAEGVYTATQSQTWERVSALANGSSQTPAYPYLPVAGHLSPMCKAFPDHNFLYTAITAEGRKMWEANIQVGKEWLPSFVIYKEGLSSLF